MYRDGLTIIVKLFRAVEESVCETAFDVKAQADAGARVIRSAF